MNDALKQLKIQELLEDNVKYLIPMYQRNYAWEETEIRQLIQDIVDYKKKNTNQSYYIGTLVVFKRPNNVYEVIDGQQRTTTLSLIAMYLKNISNRHNISEETKWYKTINIDFESRSHSRNTLKNLFEGEDVNKLPTDNLVNGYKVVTKVLNQLKDISLAEFAQYLFKEVKIMRVEVPSDTNLNHYFEVMNNRGEQLEKHEVLKARLLAKLNQMKDEEAKRNCINGINKVWEACSNMEQYVQYGFLVDERMQLFGEDWGNFNVRNFDSLIDILGRKNESNSNQIISTETPNSIQTIISKPILRSTEINENKIDTPDRFNSVINFSNFLLHVLRVWTGKDIPLDDKQLLDQFHEYLLKSGDIDDVKNFIFSLLKCKYLFDQYIIKREFSKGEEGWSLKRLKYYSKTSQSFVNSFGPLEDDNSGINRQILMLIAAFHVSNTSLVYKYWLSAALNYLYKVDEFAIKPEDYLQFLEAVAKSFVFDRFLAEDEGANYDDMIRSVLEKSQFVVHEFEVAKSIQINETKLRYVGIENNFVFNYLDYLLWRKGKVSGSPVVKNFEFTFRSSVEHFYPQHPMDGHESLKEEYLHDFGNLCLISHSKNSKLSNLQPVAKKEHFQAGLNINRIDSLKLYEMIKALGKDNTWDVNRISKHGAEMLDLLRN